MKSGALVSPPNIYPPWCIHDRCVSIRLLSQLLPSFIVACSAILSLFHFWLILLYIVKVNTFCYLCGRSCELWNNRSVSLCSCLIPTDMDRRETLWYEGSYIRRKGQYSYLSEQTIKQFTIGEQGWRSGVAVGETPPIYVARANAVCGLRCC